MFKKWYLYARVATQRGEMTVEARAHANSREDAEVFMQARAATEGWTIYTLRIEPIAHSWVEPATTKE